MNDIIDELNDRTRGYVRSGMSIDEAIKQAVIDYLPYLSRMGYRILSEDEIEQNGKTVFFEAYQ